MANITNPQAILFCNSQVRVMADKMNSSYATAKSIVNNWNALSMSSIITNDTSPIIDGSSTDGRSPITGAMATAIITRALEIIADYEATSNAKLNTVVQVKVNGAAAF